MAEKSGGELMMEISSGGALGGDQELLQQLATNEIQAHIAGPVVLHRLVPAYQCLEAEYVYEDEAHGFKVWRGPLGAGGLRRARRNSTASRSPRSARAARAS